MARNVHSFLCFLALASVLFQTSTAMSICLPRHRDGLERRTDDFLTEHPEGPLKVKVPPNRANSDIASLVGSNPGTPDPPAAAGAGAGAAAPPSSGPPKGHGPERWASLSADIDIAQPLLNPKTGETVFPTQAQLHIAPTDLDSGLRVEMVMQRTLSGELEPVIRALDAGPQGSADGISLQGREGTRRVVSRLGATTLTNEQIVSSANGKGVVMKSWMADPVVTTGGGGKVNGNIGLVRSASAGLLGWDFKMPAEMEAVLSRGEQHSSLVGPERTTRVSTVIYDVAAYDKAGKGLPPVRSTFHALPGDIVDIRTLNEPVPPGAKLFATDRAPVSAFASLSGVPFEGDSSRAAPLARDWRAVTASEDMIEIKFTDDRPVTAADDPRGQAAAEAAAADERASALAADKRLPPSLEQTSIGTVDDAIKNAQGATSAAAATATAPDANPFSPGRLLETADDLRAKGAGGAGAAAAKAKAPLPFTIPELDAAIARAGTGLPKSPSGSTSSASSWLDRAIDETIIEMKRSGSWTSEAAAATELKTGLGSLKSGLIAGQFTPKSAPGGSGGGGGGSAALSGSRGGSPTTSSGSASFLDLDGALAEIRVAQGFTDASQPKTPAQFNPKVLDVLQRSESALVEKWLSGSDGSPPGSPRPAVLDDIDGLVRDINAAPGGPGSPSGSGSTDFHSASSGSLDDALSRSGSVSSTASSVERAYRAVDVLEAIKLERAKPGSLALPSGEHGTMDVSGSLPSDQEIDSMIAEEKASVGRGSSASGSTAWEDASSGSSRASSPKSATSSDFEAAIKKGRLPADGSVTSSELEEAVRKMDADAAAADLAKSGGASAPDVSRPGPISPGQGRNGAAVPPPPPAPAAPPATPGSGASLPAEAGATETRAVVRTGGSLTRIAQVGLTTLKWTGIAMLVAAPAFIIMDFVNGNYVGGIIGVVGLGVGLAAAYGVELAVEAGLISSGPVGWVVAGVVAIFFAVLPFLFHKKKKEPHRDDVQQIIQWIMFGEVDHTGNEKCREQGNKDCQALYGPGIVSHAFGWDNFDAYAYQIHFNRGHAMSIPDMARTLHVLDAGEPAQQGGGAAAVIDCGDGDTCAKPVFTLRRNLIAIPYLNQTAEQVRKRIIPQEGGDCKLVASPVNGQHYPAYNFTITGQPATIACGIVEALNVSGVALPADRALGAPMTLSAALGNPAEQDSAHNGGEAFVAAPPWRPFKELGALDGVACFGAAKDHSSLCLPNGTYSMKDGDWGFQMRDADSLSLPQGGAIRFRGRDNIAANQTTDSKFHDYIKRSQASDKWPLYVTVPTVVPNLVCLFAETEYKGNVACYGEGGNMLPNTGRKKAKSVKVYGDAVAWVYADHYGDEGGAQISTDVPDLTSLGFGLNENWGEKIVAMWIKVG